MQIKNWGVPKVGDEIRGARVVKVEVQKEDHIVTILLPPSTDKIKFEIFEDIMQDKIQETISLLKGTFDTPILYSAIKKEYRKSVEEDKPEFFYEFAENLVAEYLEAVNYEFLLKQVSEVIKNVRETSAIDLTGVKIDDGDLKFKEVNEIIKKIYSYINDLQINRQICEEYITLLTKAKGYLMSLKKALTQVAKDTSVCKGYFVHLSERERFIEPLMTDVDAIITVFQSNIKELGSIEDKVIKSNLNILLRSDSAVRMLSKYKEFDFESNRRHTKDSFDKVNDDGFNMEEV